MRYQFFLLIRQILLESGTDGRFFFGNVYLMSMFLFCYSVCLSARRMIKPKKQSSTKFKTKSHYFDETEALSSF